MAEASPLPPTTDAEPTHLPMQNGTLAPAGAQADVEMSESIPAAQTPTHNQPTSVPTPTPATTQTPTRNSPHPSVPLSAPGHPNPHGSPTRVYLNQNVTPHLLEAMKHLVTNEPDKPLKWLSEFLAQKSLEIEGA